MKTQIAKPLLAACTFIASAFILAAPAEATAPNTTAANSVAYEVGQGWVTHYFDEATQNRWFRFGEIGGHSYCVEAVQGPVSTVQLNPNLAVYTDNTGATVLTVSSVAQSNDDGLGDPYFIRGARTCYIAPTNYGVATVRGIKLNVPITASSGDAGYLKLRVVDTTLTGVGYYNNCQGCYTVNTTNTNIYVVNNTNAALSVRTQFIPPSTSQPENILNSTPSNFQLAPGQTTYQGGYQLPFAAYGYYSGLILVAHSGPPGALQGTADKIYYTGPNQTQVVIPYELKTK